MSVPHNITVSSSISTIDNIIIKYVIIVGGYLKTMNDSDIIGRMENKDYIIYNGLNALLHIFKITLYATKNIDTTFFYCQKAQYNYLEYIEQMVSKNLLQNMGDTDVLVFLYKTSMDDVINAGKPTTNISNIVLPLDTDIDEQEITNQINTEYFNNIKHIIENITLLTKALLNTKYNSNQLVLITGEHLLNYLFLMGVYSNNEHCISNYNNYCEYLSRTTNALELTIEQYMTLLDEIYKATIVFLRTHNSFLSSLEYNEKYTQLFYSEPLSSKVKNHISKSKYKLLAKMIIL